MVTTAATHVEQDGQGWEGEFGTWSDEHMQALSELAGAISKHGGIGLTQLFHGGMRAPEQITGLQPKSASVNDLGKGLGQSRAMTEAEIHQTIRAFGTAAQRCERAGFPGGGTSRRSRLPYRSISGRLNQPTRGWLGRKPRKEDTLFERNRR